MSPWLARVARSHRSRAIGASSGLGAVPSIHVEAFVEGPRLRRPQLRSVSEVERQLRASCLSAFLHEPSR